MVYTWKVQNRLLNYSYSVGGWKTQHSRAARTRTCALAIEGIEGTHRVRTMPGTSTKNIRTASEHQKRVGKERRKKQQARTNEHYEPYVIIFYLLLTWIDVLSTSTAKPLSEDASATSTIPQTPIERT